MKAIQLGWESYCQYRRQWQLVGLVVYSAEQVVKVYFSGPRNSYSNAGPPAFCGIGGHCYTTVPMSYHAVTAIHRHLVISFVCSFSTLTLLVGSFDPLKSVPDMTYSVFGGTLSLTQSISWLFPYQAHVLGRGTCVVL